MKTVVLNGCMENPGDLSWGKLEKLGELTAYDGTSVVDKNEIISHIGDAEVVVTNKAPIIESIADACPGMKYTAMLATGYSVVGHIYAREKGILLSDVLSYGIASMDQFATVMLLELCHHVAYHSQTVHEGKRKHCQDWCYWDYPLIELDGKIMGIIGSGRTGQQIGETAKAMGMNTLAYDNYPNESGEEIAEYVDLDTLYAESDVIALHCPPFPETQGIISGDATAKMKDGVVILNNSHGPLIVEQGLINTLNSGKISGAGLDMVFTEPIKGNNPFLRTKNCIIMPHISWAPKENRQRIMNHMVENVRAHLVGAPIHVMNR